MGWRLGRFGWQRAAAIWLGTSLLAAGAPQVVAQEQPGAAVLHEQPVLVVDPGMHTVAIRRADVDRAGRFAVTGSHDKTLRLWALGAAPELIKTIRIPAGAGHVGKVYAVAMSPDGALVAAGGWTRWTQADQQDQIYLFGRAGHMVRRLDGLPNVVLHLAFSPDGRYLAAGLFGRNGIRVYDRERDWAEAARDTDYSDAVYGLAFAADGRLASTSWDGHVRLYDAAFRRIARHKTRLGRQPYGLAFQPGGSQIAVGLDDSQAVEMLGGQSLTPLAVPDASGISNGNFYGIEWSRDGQRFYAGGQYAVGGRRSVVAWAGGGQGPRSALFSGALNTILSLKSLPGGELLVAASDPHLALLATDGTPRWAKPSPKFDPRDQHQNFAVSADGATVEFGFEAWGRTRVHFDLRQLKLVKAAAPADTVAPPRQEDLAIADWIHSTRPTLDGKPLALNQYETSRSLAIHPDGQRFVLGTEWSLRAFDAKGTGLWQRAVPGVVWAVNITGDGRMAVAAYGDGTIRWHRMDDGRELMAFMPLADQANWVAWTPEGFYGATPGAAGVLQWHVNRGWDQAAEAFPLSQFRHARRPEALPLVLQEMDTFRALGLAEYAKYTREVQLKTKSKLPPGARLHYLTVGVSDYGRNATQLKLNYAAKDARDLAGALENTQTSLYAEVRAEMLIDAEATRDNILERIDTMIKAADAGDGRGLAVVHIAAHGGVIDGTYYLLPHGVDIANTATIKQTALDLPTLRQRLAQLGQYTRVLVLLDACQSGAVTGDGKILQVDGQKLRTILAEMANVTVLTSSSSSASSYEDPKWENGAFTEVVLEALGRAGDTDSNGLINVSELMAYVSEELPRLTANRPIPQKPSVEIRFQSEIFVSGL